MIVKEKSSVRAKLPLVSVCILSYNRKEELLKSIAYIQQSTYPNIEIIVVDNVSPDGAADAVAKKYKNDVVLIRHKVNNGIAGWNTAFQKAKGEYVLALDDDAHPAENAIEKIVAAFDQNRSISIIAGNILNAQTKKSAFPYITSTHQGSVEQYDFIGCGVAMRKSMFKKIGYFSDKLFMYGHESEFALRAVEAGLSIKMFPNIIIYHRVSPINRTSGRSLYYCTRNFFIIAWLYLPFFSAVNVTLSILLENAILGILNKEFSAYVRGIKSWFENWSWIIKERKPVSKSTVKRFFIHFPFSIQGLARRTISLL